MDNIQSELEKQGIDEKKIEAAVNDNKKQAEDVLKDKDKTDKLLTGAIKLCEKMKNVPVIGVVFDDVLILCSLVKDYVAGNYKEIPLATIITIVAGIIYLVAPVDLIPDVIPFLGQIDDAAVLGFVLKGVHNDLKSYEEWKITEKSE